MSKEEIKFYIEKRIGELYQANEGKLDTLAGHLASTKEDLGGVKSDVCWLKKFFWLVASSSVGAFIASLFTLMLQANK